MKKKLAPDPWAVGWTFRSLVFITFLAALLVPTGVLPIVSMPTSGSTEPDQTEGSIQRFLLDTVEEPKEEPRPTEVPYTPTPHVPRVGIIAGHAGSDAGAICEDGLQEVDVNTEIAKRVVALLSSYGWQVELLEEFDARLQGYQADALLSIHADSCNVPGRSGFKMARAESSYIPTDEDRLVDCVSNEYQQATGLAFDPYTITYDMTRYHAYYEIDPSTPAAIIEAGFMLEDRELLTERPEVVARGIADGLICFVEGESP
ncbi:MAG: N-acetylmuramoyl-L-alanine amidase [Anaerolineae bacterium]